MDGYGNNHICCRVSRGIAFERNTLEALWYALNMQLHNAAAHDTALPYAAAHDAAVII